MASVNRRSSGFGFEPWGSGFLSFSFIFLGGCSFAEAGAEKRGFRAEVLAAAEGRGLHRSLTPSFFRPAEAFRV